MAFARWELAASECLHRSKHNLLMALHHLPIYRSQASHCCEQHVSTTRLNRFPHKSTLDESPTALFGTQQTVCRPGYPGAPHLQETKAEQPQVANPGDPLCGRRISSMLEQVYQLRLSCDQCAKELRQTLEPYDGGLGICLRLGLPYAHAVARARQWEQDNPLKRRQPFILRRTAQSQPNSIRPTDHQRQLASTQQQK
jgi:hypothetical protein